MHIRIRLGTRAASVKGQFAERMKNLALKGCFRIDGTCMKSREAGPSLTGRATVKLQATAAISFMLSECDPAWA